MHYFLIPSLPLLSTFETGSRSVASVASESLCSPSRQATQVLLPTLSQYWTTTALVYREELEEQHYLLNPVSMLTVCTNQKDLGVHASGPSTQEAEAELYVSRRRLGW